MGTLETYEACWRNILPYTTGDSADNRILNVINILKEHYGLFAYKVEDGMYKDYYAVKYKGLEIHIDIIEYEVIGFDLIAGYLNEENVLDMYKVLDLVNSINCGASLVNAYYYEEYDSFIIATSQYVGNKEIDPESLSFMLKNIADYYYRYRNMITSILLS